QSDGSFIWFCHCASSLDYFVCTIQHIGRDRQADLLRGLQIDDELELGRLLDREISGLDAFQDLVYVSVRATEQVGKLWRIAHKPPVLHIFSGKEYNREPAFYREVCNPFPMRIEDGACQHKDCVCTPLTCGSKCSLNIVGTWYVQVLKL